ncbi:hypothetical protein NCAS_0D02200 [Naumovozyma castellii]|uniref:ATP synthase subunit epsilon, mitochondrial n=1 Tax=Naumovozyma castellii TaxID=27288 RepID=G0VE10_NAUCA|nr:hypothetical protein NCAS_0D02200 [Naumovozyma castellii CBS 4309]CCC69801.1 hypothetical protein NCAS_0D02200 [Naumovozyma castellii CBS 4309]
MLHYKKTLQRISTTTNPMPLSATLRKAGVTYAQYLCVASRTLRASLKTELQTPVVMARSNTDAYYTKYEKGSPIADPAPLQTSRD